MKKNIIVEINKSKDKDQKLTYRDKWMQPLFCLGILIIVIIPFVIYEFLENSNIATEMVGMTVAGIFLGYVLSRGRFGFAGPIKKITQQGDGRQAKALIYLFIISTIIAGAAMLIVPKAMPGIFNYPTLNPLGWGVIIGGLLFGIGMVLSTGCASGTLTDVGEGQIPAIVVIIFFMIGSVFGVTFYGSKMDNNFLNDGQNNSLFYLTGSIWIGVIINILVLTIILMIIIAVHKSKAQNNKQVLTKLDNNYQEFGDTEISGGSWKSFFSYESFKKIFSKRFPWLISAICVSLWFAIIVFAFGQTPGITGAYAKWGIFLTHGFGMSRALEWGPYQNFHMMSDPQAWQNIGIIVGAVAAKLLANDFKFSDYNTNKWHNWLLYALGGLLMGVGARFARGCNFGALFTGVSFATLQGWVFGILLLAGAVSASLLIVKLHHNSPPEAYEAMRRRKRK